MIAETHLETALSFAPLYLDLYPAGEDIAVVLRGGERPHIGCAVLAVPRASLRGDGEQSCTASVLNVTGHKDEVLCRAAAETLCRRYGVTVLCTGGFHQDGITPAQIREVRDALAALLGPDDDPPAL